MQQENKNIHVKDKDQIQHSGTSGREVNMIRDKVIQKSPNGLA